MEPIQPPEREGISQSQSQAATKGHGPRGLFEGYAPLSGTWDEFFQQSGIARHEALPLVDFLNALGAQGYAQRQRLADAAFLRGGVTFSVYSDTQGVEKIFPFDLIPRVITGNDWRHIEAGLEQRVQALNLFLADIYGDQKILADQVIPRDLVESSKGYLPKMAGIRPCGGSYIQIAGIDLIRDPKGDFLVLEDNLRTPSGVSYVLENRDVMRRVLPRAFDLLPTRPVQDYALQLRNALVSLSPRDE